MAVKRFKAYTPSRRNMTVLDYSEITKKTPEKSLITTKKEKAGRNAQGKITVRHQGGGNRQKYRIIDFKRNKVDMPATVIGIEYDPNRSANIALIQYEDGEKAYILAPVGLTDGDKVISGDKADIKPGNCMRIENIPVGTMIHNIELNPGQGGKLVRAAGQEAQLMAKEGKYAHVRLPSGEMRLVMSVCKAIATTPISRSRRPTSRPLCRKSNACATSWRKSAANKSPSMLSLIHILRPQKINRER